MSNDIKITLSEDRLTQIAWKFLFAMLPPDNFSSEKYIDPSKVPDPASTEMRRWLFQRAAQFDVTFNDDSTEPSYINSVAWEIVKKKFLTEGIHFNPTEVEGWYGDIGQIALWGITPAEWGVFMLTLTQFVLREYEAAVWTFIGRTQPSS